jgi:hypothetical protein
MFQPDADLSAIKPIRPCRGSRFRWRRTTLAILREANESMTARDLAFRVLEARGVPPD